MPDPAAREWTQHHRRLYTYLRALLPCGDLDTTFRVAMHRIGRGQIPARPWDDIARQVAAERRKAIDSQSFSDDLFRQLADSAGPILDQSEKRPAALAAILGQLPPPERDLLRRKYEAGLSAGQIAAADGRPVALVVRDLAVLHESLVTALREALPDVGPEPPGGAADIGRLSDQLLDGTIRDDGRLVLETLLLADAAAQAHYHRHSALAADLRWHYSGPPYLPEQASAMSVQPRMTVREWTVTAAFVAAVLAVIVFVAVRFAS